jgi:hypothetical protein
MRLEDALRGAACAQLELGGGELLVVATGAHGVVTFDAGDQQVGEAWRPEGAHELCALSCSAGGTAAVSRGGAVSFRGEAGARFHLERRGDVRHAALSRSGTRLAVLYPDEVKVVDCASGRAVVSCRVQLRKGGAHARVAMGPRGDVVVLDPVARTVQVVRPSGAGFSPRLGASPPSVASPRSGASPRSDASPRAEVWGAKELSRPAGLAVDRSSRVVVSDAGSEAVFVFSLDGRLLWSFHEDTEGGPLQGVGAVTVDAADKVLVVSMDAATKAPRYSMFKWSDDEAEQERERERERETKEQEQHERDKRLAPRSPASRASASPSRGSSAREPTYEEEGFEEEAPAPEQQGPVGLVLGQLVLAPAAASDSGLYLRCNVFHRGRCDPDKWATTPSLVCAPYEWAQAQVFDCALGAREDCHVRVELWAADALCDGFVAGARLPVSAQQLAEADDEGRRVQVRDAEGQVRGTLHVRLGWPEATRPSKGELARAAAADEASAAAREAAAATAERKALSSVGVASFAMSPRAKAEREALAAAVAACEADQAVPAEETIEQLALAVRRHHGHRRMRALARLAGSSAVLRERVSAALGEAGHRALSYHLSQRGPHKPTPTQLQSRAAAREALAALVPGFAAGQLRLLAGLESPGVWLGRRGIFFFHVPAAARRAFARQANAYDLTEQAFVAWLEAELEQRCEREPPAALISVALGGGGDNGDDEDGQDAEALGFVVAAAEVEFRIATLRSDMSWEQGVRVAKLRERFLELLQQQREVDRVVGAPAGAHNAPPAGDPCVRTAALLDDPVVGSYVATAGFPAQRWTSWEQLRSVFWYQTFQAKSGTPATVLEDIELYRALCAVNGRSMLVTWKSVRRSRGRLSSLRCDAVDQRSGRAFVREYELEAAHEPKDGLLLSAAALELLSRRLRVLACDVPREGEGENHEAEEEEKREQREEQHGGDSHALWLKRVESEREARERRKRANNPDEADGAAEALAHAMPKVAELWNAKERFKAAELLLKAAPPVLRDAATAEDSLQLRDKRLKMSLAVKQLKLDKSEKNILRLWKACERFLRLAASEAQDAAQAAALAAAEHDATTADELDPHAEAEQAPASVKPPRIAPVVALSPKASRKSRALDQALFETNRHRLESDREREVKLQEQRLEVERERTERLAREKEQSLSRLRFERTESVRQAQDAAAVVRDAEARAHAQWYREECRLQELQAAVHAEQRRKHDLRISEARRRNDAKVEAEKRRVAEQQRRGEIEQYERDKKFFADREKARLQRMAGNQKGAHQQSVPPSDAGSATSSTTSTLPETLVFEEESVRQGLRKSSLSPCAQREAQQRRRAGAGAGDSTSAREPGPRFDQVDWEEVTNWPDLPQSAATETSVKLRRKVQQARKRQAPLSPTLFHELR